MKRPSDKGKLRSGFTTGACAAAAAMAAATSLLDQRSVERVQLELPGAKPFEFQVHACSFDATLASCSVIKDAGDDPDATQGAEIVATVRFEESAGIRIDGGEGVGTVTKPGLDLPVGSPAINPVPRRMITEAVTKVAQGRLNGSGLQVVISVPEGRRLARKTLNSRLGIVGGISIIGTTGIVIPYSVSAYTASISQAVGVAKACGREQVVLTTGRRSEKFAQAELGLPEESYVLAGDFIGYSLRQCVRKGMSVVFIWGMIGKITKLAAGHMYTNISDSQVDIGFMVQLARECGISSDAIETLSGAVTANHFRKLTPAGEMRTFCDALCRLAAEKCRQYVSGKLGVECIVTDPEGTILGRGHAG